MKKDRTPKLLQDALARFIRQQMPMATFGALITITDVQVAPNLSWAKVSLSFIPTGQLVDETIFLAQVEKKSYFIKKYLAHELGQTLRLVPEVRFYIDHTAKGALELGRLLDKL